MEQSKEKQLAEFKEQSAHLAQETMLLLREMSARLNGIREISNPKWVQPAIRPRVERDAGPA